MINESINIVVLKIQEKMLWMMEKKTLEGKFFYLVSTQKNIENIEQHRKA